MNRFHIVQEHDTLTRIARQHGTTVAELRKLNDLSNPNRLKIGQKIALRKEGVCGFEALFLDADRNPIKNLSYILEFNGKSIKGVTGADGKSKKVLTDAPTDRVRVLVKRFDDTVKDVANILSGYRNKLCTLISPLLVIDAELKPHPKQKTDERPNPKERVKPAYGAHNRPKPTTEKKELGPQAKQSSTPDGKPLTVVEGDIPGLDEFLDPFNGELMTDEDYAWAAKELGVEEAAIRAYAKVESGGEKNSGFIDIGKRKVPKILYERHYFSNLTNHEFSAKYPDISLPTGYYFSGEKYIAADDGYKKKHSVPANVQYFRPISKNDMPSTKSEVIELKTMLALGKATELQDKYLAGAPNYRRLTKAYQLNKISALKICSWGAFQIMGDNWEKMGYASVYEFTRAMSRSEKEQIKAFVLYIKRVRPAIISALRNRDWDIAAKLYNGKNYKINHYDEKLQSAYRKFKEVK